MAKKRSTRASKSPPGAPAAPRELIVVADAGAGVRAAGSAARSTAGAAVDDITSALAEAGAEMRPIFGSSEERASAKRSALEASGVQTPDLSVYYSVAVDEERMDALAERLASCAAVQTAYIKPPSEPPVLNLDESEAEAQPSDDTPPATPDFVSRQGYRRAAPEGVDADWANNQPGGHGAGVGIIDIEGAWNFAHEDLLQNQGGVIGGTQSSNIDWRNHGTAVVGEFGGDRNSFGVTGISSDSNTRAISIFGGTGSAGAITQAADALNPGDIVLIELHRPGPRHNFQSRRDQLGYIAIEWWPDDFAAIQYAVGKGVIVVEAAGNGAEDLDDALYDARPAGFPAGWQNPFNTANPSSGAVVVGAGAPPPGTHGSNHGPDRSRLGFSNYGARVDAQGWGREVTTTGYGTLQGGNENVWYRDTFSGTSSASPIVVGALACVQGILAAGGNAKATPAKAIEVLRNTGSPQQDAPGRPATQRIGNRPDIRAAIAYLAPATVQSGVATRFWNELVAHPPGSAASLWLFVGGQWRRSDTASNADRIAVQKAFLGSTGSQVRVWYQNDVVVGLVVEGS